MLGGAQLFIGERVGLLVELGWMRHEVNASATADDMTIEGKWDFNQFAISISSWCSSVPGLRCNVTGVSSGGGERRVAEAIGVRHVCVH